MFDTGSGGGIISLVSRTIAAVIGSLAGAATYLVWVFFEARRWGEAASLDFFGLGKWFVAAGAALGFFGGLAFAAELWSNSWQSLRDESSSLITVVLVVVTLVLACFFVYRKFLAPI